MSQMDLLRDCMASTGLPQDTQSAEDFARFFCKLCWNTDCPRAEQVDLPWERRMATQVERLLTHPNFAAENDPRFENIRRIPFKDMFRDAVRLEIANQRGDWQVPVLPGDPGEELETLAPPQHTDHVDQAAKALAQALGKEEPTIPEATEKPEAPVPPKEIPVPSHFVRKENRSQQANTDFPLEGVMVGGDPIPEQAPKTPEVDPWAVPVQKGEKVSVGGTVKMGSPPKDGEKE